MAESALRCPRGHDLGEASLSWDMQLKVHYLYCVACRWRSRIAQVDGARWEVLEGQQWVES